MKRRSFFKNLLQAGAGALILPQYTFSSPTPDIIQQPELIQEPILQFYNRWLLNHGIGTTTLEVWGAPGLDWEYLKNIAMNSTAVEIFLHDFQGHMQSIYSGKFYLSQFTMTSEVEGPETYDLEFYLTGALINSPF